MTKTAAEILDPWLNGDPCADCNECEKVCRKLQERVDTAINAMKEKLTEAIQVVRQADNAMEYMGEVLNGMDAVTEYDIKETTPAFLAVRAFLARTEKSDGEKA